VRRMDTGDRRLRASGTFDAMEALEMIQVELGGTVEHTGHDRAESGDTSLAGAAVGDAAPAAPRPHVEPDWREE